MKATEIMKRSFHTAWNNKRLWIFGLFVAAMSSGSGGDSSGGGSGGAEALPSWLPIVIIVAVVIALGALVMNIISEAALIAGIDRTRLQGDRTFSIREGLRLGVRHFRPVLLLKVLFGVVNGLSGGLVALPAALGGLGVVPLWAGLTMTGVLVLPAIPWLLTLYFLRQYALRIAVLERCGTMEALRGSKDHLHGRIADSLVLFGVSLVGVVASTVAMGAFLLPAAVLGGAVYLATSLLLPAIITGAAIMIPGALCALGFQGTYRSGVWTLGYLEATEARA
jgi:hypothetical protein